METTTSSFQLENYSTFSNMDSTSEGLGMEATTLDSYPPSHVLPAAITGVACIGLVILMVIGLKACALLRRQRTLSFVRRSFTLSSESQQHLPVKTKVKEKRGKALLSGSHKNFQTRVVNDNVSVDGSSEQELNSDGTHADDGLESPEEATSASSGNSLHDIEAGCSNNYVSLNSELLKKEVQVEVEVHPSIFQDDIKNKSLLSKIARGSCSEEQEYDLCTGL